MAVLIPTIRLPWQLTISRGESDPRALLARPQPLRYAMLMSQLALISAASLALRIEQREFVGMLILVSAGFAIHYWLPFHLKEPFLIALSVAAGFLLLNVYVAGLLLVTGLAIFGILAMPIRYSIRLGVVLLLVAGLTLLRTAGSAQSGVPEGFWPILGSIFMFRLIIYLYDLRHAKGRPNLSEYLSYFFIIPNYYFLLFPVVDFQTMRKSYFQRDIHESAQVGIRWIVRGLVQLLAYRLIVQVGGTWEAPAITTFPDLVRGMIMVYLLYLHVSGTFHIIVGLLHLFGYNLPETHRRYLLASSLTDFWRRINIYWKDFMVKTVYFPAYFRLRKGGEMRAQVVATALVFPATWFLHAYQSFWLSGKFLLKETDIAFWGILGGLVVANVYADARRKRSRQPAAQAWGPRIWRGLQIAVTFSLIVFVWSLWNTSSFAEWLDILAWWQPRSW